MSFYDTIPEVPDEISNTNIIARLVDGLGFRYHWATKSLSDKALIFRPVDPGWNMLELIKHIHRLAFTANRVFGGTASYDKNLSEFAAIREETLRLYANLSEGLKNMEDEKLPQCSVKSSSRPDEFPFWYLLNGHLADALTHVGQVISWRKMAGDPMPEGVQVFLGKKM